LNIGQGASAIVLQKPIVDIEALPKKGKVQRSLVGVKRRIEPQVSYLPLDIFYNVLLPSFLNIVCSSLFHYLSEFVVFGET